MTNAKSKSQNLTIRSSWRTPHHMRRENKASQVLLYFFNFSLPLSFGKSYKKQFYLGESPKLVNPPTHPPHVIA